MNIIHEIGKKQQNKHSETDGQMDGQMDERSETNITSYNYIVLEN